MNFLPSDQLAAWLELLARVLECTHQGGSKASMPDAMPRGASKTHMHVVAQDPANQLLLAKQKTIRVKPQAEYTFFEKSPLCLVADARETTGRIWRDLIV